MFLNHNDKAFAKAQADKLIRLFPPAMESSLNQRKVEVRLHNVLASIFQETSAFQKQRKLGWIRKSLFAHAFRCQLEAAGYSKAFSGDLGKTIAKHIALAG